MNRRAGLVVCIAVLAYASPAPAQVVSPAADREAREHFERGRDAFTQGDYPLAAGEFELAYALSRRSALQYNIGTAYERLHRWGEARQAFQRYLDGNPAAPDRPEIEARLRVISAELTRQAAAQQVVVRAIVPHQVLVVVPQSLPPDASRPWRTVSWVTGLLAAASGGVTIALGIVTNQRYSTLLGTCAPACLQVDVDDMRQREVFVNVGIAATSVLAVAAGGALLLDILRPRDALATAPRAMVLPIPGGAAVTLGGAL